MERILSAEVEIKVQDAANNLDELADKTSQAAASVDKSIDKLSNAGKNVGAGLDKGTKKATASVDKMQKDIASDASKVEKDLAKIAVAASKTGDRLDKALPNAAGKSAQALTNLNRVIQDAPFGIIGIANNIDPLVQSFQSLQRSTGSTKAAIGALLSSLAGPTGILFAFSAISTGATLLVQKYGSLGQAIKVLTGQAKELTEEQKKFAEAQTKLAESIEKQKIETEQLVKVARGDIGSKAEQKAALDQLNKAIPDYIGVLTEANIKTAEGVKIINEYTNALIKQATAELLVNQAAELGAKRFDAGNKFINDRTTLLNKLTELQKKQASLEKAGAAQRASESFATRQQDVTRAIQDTNEEVKELDKNYFLTVRNINQRIQKLREEIDKNTVILSTGFDEGKLKKDIKDIKRILLEADFTVPLAKIEPPKINTGEIELPLTPTIDVQQTDFLDKFRSTLDGLRDDLEGSFEGFDFSGIITKEYKDAIDGVKGMAEKGGLEDAFISADFLSKLQARFALIKQATQTFINDIQNAVKDFQLGGLVNLGQSIGNAMAEGTNALQAAGKSILASIGSLLQKIGAAIITYAISLAKIKKFLQSGIFANPVFGITIGLAAIALGSALQASIPKFANGGIVTGPTLGLIGEAGQPEVILPLNKLNQFMSGGGSVVVLESVIKGSDLALIQSRTSGRQNRNF